MSYELIIRPEAEADLAEQFDWYEARRKGLGHAFLDEVSAVIRQIEQNPLSHPPMYRNVRRALVRRFPFKVFYLFESEKVQLIGVLHARRHPQGWQQRGR